MGNSWQKISRTRVTYFADDLFDVGMGEDVFVCLPIWAWYVARSFLQGYGERRTSFAMEYVTGLYRKPNDAEFDLISAYISKALGADVTCTSEMIDALNGIQLAIEAGATAGCGGCGTGSGGASGSQPPASEFIDDGVNFPEGNYADYDDYKSTKCSLARQVFSELVTDVTWFQTASIGSLVAAALAVAFLTPIPFDDLVALAAIALTFLVEGLLSGISSSLVSKINGAEADLVCALYEAETEGEAEVDFLAVLSLTGSEALLLGYFLSPASFNKMFDFSTAGDDSTPCSCEEGCLTCYFIARGSGVPDSVLTSEPFGAGYAITIIINSTSTDLCADSCSGQLPANIISLTNWTVASFTSSFQVAEYSVPGDPCGGVFGSWNSDTQWPDGTVGVDFTIISDTPFTARLDLCI